MRVGIGFDAHRLEKGRRLVLGGVEVPCERGLSGHSDADVLIHALIDSLLGAGGKGDIGHHFPDDDPRYQDISSRELLTSTYQLLAREGLRVGNVDAVIAAQEPRLSPHVGAMRAGLAELLHVDVSRVNVKATTTEGMGFTGRGEGIASWVVVCLEEAAET